MDEPTKKISGRKLKAQILRLLNQEDFTSSLDQICRLPLRQVVNPLFSFLYNRDDRIRWRAVAAMGAVVSNTAESDMESARIVMRRLLWNLNDESGGIGWGSPEAMGEIMAGNQKLAEEYSSILCSYIDKNGNYLEYEPLQKGAVWGIGRLASAFPQFVIQSAALLIPFFSSADALLRGYAAWAGGALNVDLLKPYIERLAHDDEKIIMYRNGYMVNCTIGELVRESLGGKKILPG